MPSFKHVFHTTKGDGPDTTLVKPSDWNAEHAMTTEAEGVVLGRATGAGPGAVQELSLNAMFLPGMLMPFAGDYEPAGWMLCDGRSLSRTTYGALFSVIAGRYGSVDAASFSLPDLRGRVAVMKDPGTGRLTGSSMTSPHLVGGYGGQETEQAYADISVGGVRAYGATYGGGLGVHVEMDTWQTDGWGCAMGGGPLVGSHSHHMAGDFGIYGALATYVDTPAIGGGGYTRAVTNVQPSLVINYLIKY